MRLTGSETPPSDEDLARRARAGEEDAFGLLFARYAGRLQGRVRRRLPANVKRKVAESDVFQDAMLGAFRRLTEFEDRGEGSFDAWLTRILDNKIKDAMRRYVGTAKRGVGREVTRANRAETAESSARSPSPSAEAIAGELEIQVAEGLEQLPPDYRTVLELVQRERLTLAAAAVRLGRTRDATSKLYGRALSRLAKIVEGGA